MKLKTIIILLIYFFAVYIMKPNANLNFIIFAFKWLFFLGFQPLLYYSIVLLIESIVDKKKEIVKGYYVEKDLTFISLLNNVKGNNIFFIMYEIYLNMVRGYKRVLYKWLYVIKINWVESSLVFLFLIVGLYNIIFLL